MGATAAAVVLICSPAQAHSHCYFGSHSKYIGHNTWVTYGQFKTCEHLTARSNPTKLRS